MPTRCDGNPVCESGLGESYGTNEGETGPADSRPGHTNSLSVRAGPAPTPALF